MVVFTSGIVDDGSSPGRGRVLVLPWVPVGVSSVWNGASWVGEGFGTLLGPEGSGDSSGASLACLRPVGWGLGLGGFVV